MRKLNERKEVYDFVQNIQDLYLKGITPESITIDYVSHDRSIDYVVKVEVRSKHNFELDISGECRIDHNGIVFEANLNQAERIDDSTNSFTIIFDDFYVTLDY